MTHGELAALAASFKKHAMEGVMPFWMRHAIDEEYGGFWTSLERDGTRYGDGNKFLVVQTRTIYSMCVAYRLSGQQEYLDQAAQGARFFRRYFRDAENGGWVWSTTRDGQHIDVSKNTYGLAFAIYGLAEYARLTKDADALQDAVDTYELMMQHCWDTEYGAFYDELSADWKVIRDTKRVDTQMHTMEGVSALLAATGEHCYLETLKLLAETILGGVGKHGFFDASNNCILERFHRDWSKPVDDMYRGRVIYGHLVEAGWFISILAAYTGSSRLSSLGKRLIEHALRCGWDDERGGIYHLGTPQGEVTKPDKLWWPQAEMLGALSFLYRQSGEDRYLKLLQRQAAFIDQEILDHKYGGWHSAVALKQAKAPRKWEDFGI
jgi:mannobiose 2-epimerase